MPTSFRAKIKQQAQEHLEDGEQVLAAFVAEPRGAMMTRAGGPLSHVVGRRKVRRTGKAAAAAGLRLTWPMALALTERRLVVLSITRPIAMGKGGDVKALFSAVPLVAIDAIKVKRLLVGKVVIVSIHGVPIKLETGPGAFDKAIIKQFERAKAACLSLRHPRDAEA